MIEKPMRWDIFQDVAIEAEGVDLMISNSAAVSTFAHYLSFYPRHDETLLSLSRADAWITACAVLLTIPDRKGGTKTRNSKEHSKAFCLKLFQQESNPLQCPGKIETWTSHLPVTRHRLRLYGSARV